MRCRRSGQDRPVLWGVVDRVDPAVVGLDMAVPAAAKHPMAR
jgi:hypothetical protein